MPRFRLPLRVLAVSGLLLTLPVRAMSVIPPTMDELVAAAETIVRGVVTDVHAEEFDTPEGRGVRTLVTLHVEHVMKGSPGENVTLSLLGGRAGHHTLRVPGMPQFHVGDREIVFYAKNGSAFCPLISGGHGRYHVRHDSASNHDYVARDNGLPLTSTDEISAPLDNSAAAASARSPAHALAPADFESRIASTVLAQGRPRNLP